MVPTDGIGRYTHRHWSPFLLRHRQVTVPDVARDLPGGFGLAFVDSNVFADVIHRSATTVRHELDGVATAFDGPVAGHAHFLHVEREVAPEHA
jgi:hypothetical protein